MVLGTQRGEPGFANRVLSACIPSVSWILTPADVIIIAKVFQTMFLRLIGYLLFAIKSYFNSLSRRVETDSPRVLAARVWLPSLPAQEIMFQTLYHLLVSHIFLKKAPMAGFYQIIQRCVTAYLRRKIFRQYFIFGE